MRISLVVCTRNRDRQLGRCLAAIDALKFASTWELVLVDNGSTDRTAEIVAEFAAQASCPVQYVFEPKPGLARARNRGLAAAQGEIIAFTDDDCYPEPDFLDAIDQAFSDAQVGYVGGRIRLFDPSDFPITILESTEAVALAAGSYLKAGVIQGANMAFRRQTLDQIGGFDPLFGSGAAFPCEDIDALARASLAGWGGAYDPAIVVFHHHGRKASDAEALMRAYDIGRGAYHMKMLLRFGQWDWFYRSLRELKWRAADDPASVKCELKGGLTYAAALLMSPFRRP